MILKLPLSIEDKSAGVAGNIISLLTWEQGIDKEVDYWVNWTMHEAPVFKTVVN